MSEHIATETIKRYLNRQLNSSELLKADGHLAKCDLCLMKAADLRETEKNAGFEFLRDSPGEFTHLTYAQLENYVDKKSDEVEREIADVHFESCADCKLQLDELFEMRKLIDADLQREVFTRDKESVFSQIRNLFSGKYVLRYGFAAAAILVFVSGFIGLLKRDSSNEIAVVNEPSNIISPKPLIENSAANLKENISTTADNTNSKTNTNTHLQPPIEDETEKLPPRYRTEIERVVAENRLIFPAELNRLKNQNGTLMSGADSETIPFALSTPVGKIVLSNAPQFRWQPLAGAENYFVNIYDENYNPVASSGQISATNWKINKPLARNKTYIWQVTAIKDGEEIKSPVRPAPDARFKILDAKTADELSRLSRQYNNEHLLLGIKYAKAGLLNEAESELRKELAKNPQSKTAQKFLQEIRAKNNMK